MFINQTLVVVCPLFYLLKSIFYMKFDCVWTLLPIGLLIPSERLIAVDQSHQTDSAINSKKNGFLYMKVKAAPGYYYLVFLVPGVENLILNHAFYFSLIWRTSLQCQAVVGTKAVHVALSQSSN